MFRNPEVKLSKNAEVALRHFVSLEWWFMEHSEYAKRYTAIVNEFIASGHAKPVEKETLKPNGSI